MRQNFRAVVGILSILLIINSGFMLLSAPFSFYYGEDWKPLIFSAAINLVLGVSIRWLSNRKPPGELKKRHGYLVVSLGWVVLSLSGSLPYVLSGTIPEYTNAFFETISGYTTTGASILDDIESMPKGILFWRSMTQWMGGMGIIVLAVAILPLLGIGGMQLFGAEVPGISTDKLKPRIQDTAKRLWYIYVVFTVTECVLLMFGGMTFFDAINHSLTTMATGGFSTKNASIAHYESSYIHYVIMLFMFLAGTSFTLSYFGFKGKFKKIWNNEEFRIYLLFSIGMAMAISLGVYLISDLDPAQSLRDGMFQVISVITSTGFVSADFSSWSPFITMVFFALMFVGGSSGSTAGGVKVVRHLVLFKNSFLEMKRQLNPSAVIPVRLNGNAISQDITFNVLAFMMLYLTIFSIGCVILAWMGMDFQSALGASATCIGNIGPGLGTVGPVFNFEQVPDGGKWMLAALMLIGRLEIFTVLILLSPNFWTKS